MAEAYCNKVALARHHDFLQAIREGVPYAIMITRAPESANATHDRWSELSATSSENWDRRLQDMFVAFVAEAKETNGHGAVRQSCARFDVNTSSYHYWANRLKTKNDVVATNGAEQGTNGKHAEVAVAIDTHRTNTRERWENALREMDELAMARNDDILGGGVMIIRLRLDELVKQGVRFDAATPSTAAEIAPTETTPDVAPQQPAHTTPEQTNGTAAREQPTVEPSPTPHTIAVDARKKAVAVVEPKKIEPEQPKQTRENAFILQVQLEMSIGVSTYARALELATEECMREFNKKNRSAGWKERSEFEQHVKQSLEKFDARRDGDFRRYVQRGIVSHTPSRQEQTKAQIIFTGILNKMSRRQEEPADAQKHAATIAWARRSRGIQAENFLDVMRAVLEEYEASIVAYAAKAHSNEASSLSLEQVIDIFADSAAQSVWFFDPRMNGDLDGFIRKGFELKRERHFGK